jgi:hypothetical protein
LKSSQKASKNLKKKKMSRKLRRVARDKKTGVPKKYLSGSKNRAAKAAEIKKTAELYKKGLFIDIKAVQKSRVEQNVNKTKSKTTKRRRKKGT